MECRCLAHEVHSADISGCLLVVVVFFCFFPDWLWVFAHMFLTVYLFPVLPKRCSVVSLPITSLLSAL